MSLDLAAFHAYAQGELSVYPGDWFGDAALVAEEVGRLREAHGLLSSAYAHLKSGQKAKAERLRDAARAALAQDTVER